MTFKVGLAVGLVVGGFLTSFYGFDMLSDIPFVVGVGAMAVGAGIFIQILLGY